MQHIFGEIVKVDAVVVFVVVFGEICDIIVLVEDLYGKPELFCLKIFLSFQGDPILCGPVPRLNPPPNNLQLGSPRIPRQYGLACPTGQSVCNLRVPFVSAISFA